MRATRESGKGFQTEKEEEDKLGQIFCKEQKHQNCLYSHERTEGILSWGTSGTRGRETPDLLVEGRGR